MNKMNFKTDYEIGEVIKRKIMVDNDGHSDWSAKEYPGTVIYVHPKKYFITLEFELPGGKIRESYNLPLSKQISKVFS